MEQKPLGEFKLVSPAQAAQRELAWMLYITAGYSGNVQRALAVNAYTLDQSILSLMERAIDACAIIDAELRDAMRRIEG